MPWFFLGWFLSQRKNRSAGFFDWLVKLVGCALGSWQGSVPFGCGVSYSLRWMWSDITTGRKNQRVLLTEISTVCTSLDPINWNWIEIWIACLCGEETSIDISLILGSYLFICCCNDNLTVYTTVGVRFWNRSFWTLHPKSGWNGLSPLLVRTMFRTESLIASISDLLIKSPVSGFGLKDRLMSCACVLYFVVCVVVDAIILPLIFVLEVA